MNFNLDPVDLLTIEQKEKLSVIAFSKVKEQLEAIKVKPTTLKLDIAKLDSIEDRLNDALYETDYTEIAEGIINKLKTSLNLGENK